MTGKSFAERDRALFDRIASGYARKDLSPAAQLARRQRLDQTLLHLPRPKGLDMLEVGCGAGFAADYLEGRYKSYLGVDYSAELIRFAKQENRRKGAEFICMDVEALTSERQFDTIFMIGVLHHLEKPLEVMQQLRRLLRPGGVLVVNEPQRGNPVVGMARKLRKKFDSGYSEDQREYSPAELVSLFGEAGYTEVGAFPQGVLSTPFAEIVMPFQKIAKNVAILSCAADRWLESHDNAVTRKVAWNVVVQGRAAERDQGGGASTSPTEGLKSG